MQVVGKLIEQKPENTDHFFLSVSKTKTFLQCPAKYRLAYIEKLPKKDWEFQKFGVFCHEVLEQFHIEWLNRPLETINNLMKECFNKTRIEWKDKLTKESLQESYQILTGYLSYLSKQIQEETLPRFTDLEKHFYININDQIIVNGFIDRIQIDPDGVLRVVDYKTSKQKKYLQKDYFQLLTYAYAIYLGNPELKKIRASYMMLRHNFDELVVEYTVDEIMKVEKSFIDYVEQIKTEKLYRPNTGFLCNYCDYQDPKLCPEGFAFGKSKKPQLPVIKKTGFTDW